MAKVIEAQEKVDCGNVVQFAWPKPTMKLSVFGSVLWVVGSTLGRRWDLALYFAL